MLNPELREEVLLLPLPELIELLRLANEEALSLLSEESIDEISADELRHVSVDTINQLYGAGYLYTTTDVKKILKLNSNEAVSYATRAKTYALEALKVGRSWFFTAAWVAKYQKETSRK
jgi:hypothetical protein